MTIKINTEKIGLARPIKVKSSLKMRKLSNEIMSTLNKVQIKGIRQQIAAEKAQKNDDNPDENNLEAQLKNAEGNHEQIELTESVVDKSLDFIKKVLKLNSKQMDTVEENVENEEQLGVYVSYIVARLNGVSDKEFEDSQKQEADTQNNESLKKD